ncbi:succinyl-diaminopimelate desuccinylase [Bifidobacterium leontopitheci]|uniref:Succinyl-diaminopimelate desuccinylase n=1 Tax=Bifidobacterium leontopitheci TaxID=2650774 RepID=A0A6I1GHG1_9BIFI|nr:succinyl-diaminopimelate desuccinylase [Bifidobacterium leontopitheci]KAB7791090.1 DapE Succinyl-diaminopimelate desuccinylase [Bifidobacterium leontopitheci]
MTNAAQSVNHDSSVTSSPTTSPTLGFGTAGTREARLSALFEQIMGVYSVSDDETALADAVERFLHGFGHLTVRRHGDTVVASTGLGRERRVVLAGHLDTVPVIDNFPPRWLEPGDALIRGDVAAAHPSERVMWGRGATDMKASDAVLLYLAATLTRPRYDLTFVFYDHEEVAAEKNGLRKVAEAHPDWIAGDFAVIGEPTDCGIEGGCNGTIRFDVVTHGVAAHSARAWMGVNAIHKAAGILNRLNAYEPADVPVDGLVYREGLNATLISGGKGTNVIPDECRVHVNYRFAPDKSIAEAKALMMGADAGAELGNGEHTATGGVFEGFGIEMKDESPSARPGMDAPLAVSLADLVRERTGREPLAKLGWTDVARFAALGVPAVNLGAGSPLLAHKHDEQIAEGELATMASILEDWLTA